MVVGISMMILKAIANMGEYKKERALDGHAQEAQIHLLKLILENESKFTMDKEIKTLIYNK